VQISQGQAGVHPFRAIKSNRSKSFRVICRRSHGESDRFDRDYLDRDLGSLLEGTVHRRIDRPVGAPSPVISH
jgi:hypothetical protein